MDRKYKIALCRFRISEHSLNRDRQTDTFIEPICYRFFGENTNIIKGPY